jgi:hypothetical protein
MAEAQKIVGTITDMRQREMRLSSSSASTGALITNGYGNYNARGSATTRNGYLAPPPRLLSSPPLPLGSDRDSRGTVVSGVTQGGQDSVETFPSYKSSSYYRENYSPVPETRWI